ncbi:hypothetical protein JCM10212_002848 [Sporobolomyces blumeae]
MPSTKAVESLPTVQVPPRGKGRRGRSFKPVVLVLAVALLSLWRYSGHTLLTLRNLAAPPGVFWSACPDHAESYCSFLRVPLDYTAPRPNETVSLALRMLPATVPPSEQLGYLFINPGGPGGSGTHAVLSLGPELQVILQGRYHVVSWDPRAVNLTSPNLGCFDTEGDANRFARDIINLGLPYDARGDPSLTSSRTSELVWTTKFDAYTQSLQSACAENADKGIMRTSSTAFAARDMWSIAQALGEEKVNYWGFSYGTILGATFAAMFPDKINRFVLDGVSDSVSYTRDMWQWGKDGMADTRKTFDGFLSSCAEAGQERCAFAQVNSTLESLKHRLETMYDNLRERPLAVGSSSAGPGIVTASDAQYAVFHSLYSPATWPKLASLLAEVDRGDGKRMFETSQEPTKDLCRRPPAKNPFHHAMFGSIASSAAIMCGDTDPRAIQNDTSIEGLRDYIERLSEETGSPTSEMWAMWIAQCRRWSPRPVEVYRGPWTVEDGRNKTSFPIVFLSLTADPVTPLSSAQRMVERFGPESATLLVQNGFGHCSVAHPSTCTAKTVRAYFLDGEVPRSNTTCDADPKFLFPAGTATRAVAQDGEGSQSGEDDELRSALARLAERTIERSHRLGPI